jgi:hypothetical protein
MEHTLTPLEAWDNFVEHVIPTLPKPIPREIQHARYSREGRGTYKPLGKDRIKRLLEKYAPGRYEFREVVILHETKE